MRKRHVFRPVALDRLEDRVALSQASASIAVLAHVGTRNHAASGAVQASARRPRPARVEIQHPHLGHYNGMFY